MGGAVRPVRDDKSAGAGRHMEARIPRRLPTGHVDRPARCDARRPAQLERAKGDPRVGGGMDAEAHDMSAHNGFRLLRREPYVRRTDGALSELLTWEKPCATCGALFTIKTGPGAETHPERHSNLNLANCPEHRG